MVTPNRRSSACSCVKLHSVLESTTFSSISAFISQDKWAVYGAVGASICNAIVNVASLLVSIDLLYDWVTAGVRPTTAANFWVQVALLIGQCVFFCLNSYCYYIVFLSHKRETAVLILKECKNHELLFSYWDRVQVHIWDYWSCYEVVIHEVARCALCIAVGLWLLWDVVLVVLSAVLCIEAVTHVIATIFYRGMTQDRDWAAFFERRAYDWVRCRQILQHYKRWEPLVNTGEALVNSISQQCVARLRTVLFVGSKASYMIAMVFTGTLAPVVIAPFMATPSAISPRALWMLSSVLRIHRGHSSCCDCCDLFGSYRWHKGRFRVGIRPCIRL